MSDTQEVILDVRGMTCASCESHVTSALSTLRGVRNATASFRTGEARVTVDPAVRPQQIEQTLANAGYPGTVRIPAAERNQAPRTGGEDYDLVILGGGSAAFAAALRARELGARVAMVNAGAIGGTCVNVGCVPSKTLIRAAETQYRRIHHPFNGVARTNGAPSWTAIRNQKDELVARLRSAKYEDILAGHDAIDLYPHHGTVSGEGVIALDDGRSVRGTKLLIATGSSARVSPIPGLAGSGYLDSTTAMALDTLPASMVVVGAGFVGTELGQMFSRLGVRVTIISRRSTVLPHDDPAVGAALTEYLRGEGIEIVTDATVTRVQRYGSYTVEYELNGTSHTVLAEQLLMATGRRANTERSGLDAIGVKLGERGEILVDEHLQTTRSNVYAAGDVIGDPMFVYLAAHAGAVAAENALNGNQTPFAPRAVPRVTFTDPAAATVGVTEAEARTNGLEPIVSNLPLEHVPRALAARDTRGFVKLVADATSRQILGAHILASEAGEMIMEPAMAIRFGLTIDDLTSTLHPYLTLSEGIKLAAQTFDKDVSQLSCCAA